MTLAIREIVAVTHEERERMNLLCKLIQEVRDPKMFGALVAELDELLATKEECSTKAKT